MISRGIIIFTSGAIIAIAIPSLLILIFIQDLHNLYGKIFILREPYSTIRQKKTI